MEILSVHPLSQRQFVTRGVTKFVLHDDRYEWQFTDVTGVVRDSASAPIAGAQVSIASASFSTSAITTSTGSYSISGVPIGGRTSRQTAGIGIG